MLNLKLLVGKKRRNKQTRKPASTPQTQNPPAQPYKTVYTFYEPMYFKLNKV